MSPNPSRVLVLSILILLESTSLLSPVSLYGSNIGFNSTINLSNDLIPSGFPVIAASGNNVYTAWLNNTAGNSNVLFRASNNNGSTWGSIISLSNTPNGNAVNIQAAAAGNNVYIVWQNNVSATNNDIFFRASNNNGSSFGSVINLSSDSADSNGPEVAAVGSFVYVVWVTAATPPDILFKASNNNGASFGSMVNISGNAHSVTLTDMVQIAAVATNVYITYRDNSPGRAQTFFSRSTNNGSTFSTPVSLSSTPTGETDLYQQIAAVGTNVYVTWTNDTATRDNTMFAASINSGLSFNPAINIYKGQYIDLNPVLAASGNNVYLSWTNTTSTGTTDVLYRSSTNNGASFGSIINLSNTPGTSNHQVIGASGTNVYAAWVETIGSSNEEVYVVSSNDNGATFGTPQNLSNNLGFSELPAMAALSGNVYLAWQDDTPGNDDILFRASTGAPFDFSITNSGGVNLANSKTTLITVTLSSGTAQTTSLSCTSGLPSGVTCSFTTSSGLPTYTSTLTINAYLITAGTYTITVTGASGSLNHITQFSLTIPQSLAASGSRYAN